MEDLLFYHSRLLAGFCVLLLFLTQHICQSRVTSMPPYSGMQAGKWCPTHLKVLWKQPFRAFSQGKERKKVMILLPFGAFVSPLPSGCECQVKKKGMRRRIRDGAETGSSAVSSAAVRHSPSDLQPKTALSLLERRTIPRVEEGPGGWVGRVCVCVCVGVGGEEEEERTGGVLDRFAGAVRRLCAWKPL